VKNIFRTFDFFKPLNPFNFIIVFNEKGGFMEKAKSIFFTFLLLLAFKGYSQDNELKVYPKNNQTVEQQQQDENQCAAYADDQTKGGKHTMLKNSGIGAGIGAIGGKILGKPLAGAAIGGAAGAYRGNKKSKKERDTFDQTYASCLQDKGYNLDIQQRGKKSNKRNKQNSFDQQDQQYDQGRNYNNSQQYDQGRNNQYQQDQQQNDQDQQDRGSY
jgi:outer membrane lipoprotein SlyB